MYPLLDEKHCRKVVQTKPPHDQGARVIVRALLLILFTAENFATTTVAIFVENNAEIPQ